MAAALVLLPTLSLTSFQAATADPQPAPRQSAGRESSTPSRPASDCLQACLYFKRKATRRLRLLGERERRIVALLKRLRGGDGSSNGTGVSGGRAGSKLPVPHLSAWLCIHSHEGAWNDAGDPYWGGLQMDRAFMSAYAPGWLLARGWANVWRPREQMWVAERAYSSGRGFDPWPTTAAMCGL